MHAVAQRIAEAARERTGVLIVGEPGTGRRLVARLIDARSGNGSRAAQAVLDSAAAPAASIEQHLFGTAPHGGRRPGRAGPEPITRSSLLGQTIGGSLLLLNLVDMPERVQARLARVLRDGEVTIDDERRTCPADIRPMACVEPAFDVAVQEGTIRADLHRCLSRIRIEIPPLRARREDIRDLVDFFAADICRASNLPAKTVTAPALTLLAALRYRGNARELRALLEAIVSRTPAPAIDLDDVVAQLRFGDSLDAVNPLGTLRAARMQFERDYILEALRHHRGRVTETARVLGIQRANLYRKMRGLRITLRNDRPVR